MIDTWRCSIELDPRILYRLANHHGSSLECLYFEMLGNGQELGYDISTFSKFCSLKTLRWGRVRSAKDMPALMRILKTSAASLRTLSLDYDSLGINTHLDDNEVLKDCDTDDIKLWHITEYQTPMRGIGPRMVNPLIPLSQIQRLRLTHPRFKVDVASLGPTTTENLLHFDRLVEFEINHIRNVPADIKAGIFRHGETLKILFICGATVESFCKTFSAAELLELGHRCPNLVELAISQNFRIPTHKRTHPGSLFHTLTEFPLHVFRNLELLFLSIPFTGNEPLLDDGYFKNDAFGQSGVMRTLLETMLNGNRDLPQPGNYESITAVPPEPSDKLKIVGMGIGSPEWALHIYAQGAHTPRLWRARHPSADDGPITLSLANFEDVMDRDPGWKLLRRYHLLLPNEGLRGIFRQPHLPPSSEFISARN
ncbi:hypothetical protein TWF281_010736 [Arthrobotrys megalospora]